MAGCSQIKNNQCFYLKFTDSSHSHIHEVFRRKNKLEQRKRKGEARTRWSGTESFLKFQLLFGISKTFGSRILSLDLTRNWTQVLLKHSTVSFLKHIFKDLSPSYFLFKFQRTMISHESWNLRFEGIFLNNAKCEPIYVLKFAIFLLAKDY